MLILNNRYVQLFGAYFIYSLVGVVAKYAAKSHLGLRFLLLIGIEFALLVIYALIWQQVLKKFNLITAMACKGVVVILSLIWAPVFFNEQIKINHIIGSIIITIGIFVISRDEVSNAE